MTSLDQPLPLHELASDHGATRRGKLGIIVVTVYGRRSAPVKERPRAGPQHSGRIRRVGLGAGSDEQHVVEVTLGEQPLTCGNLQDEAHVLRALGQRDRYGDARR